MGDVGRCWLYDDLDLREIRARLPRYWSVLRFGEWLGEHSHGTSVGLVVYLPPPTEEMEGSGGGDVVTGNVKGLRFGPGTLSDLGLIHGFTRIRLTRLRVRVTTGRELSDICTYVLYIID